MSIVTASDGREKYMSTLILEIIFSTNTRQLKNQVLRLLPYVFHLLQHYWPIFPCLCCQATNPDMSISYKEFENPKKITIRVHV